MAAHTPGPDATKHLIALHDAIDKVQPLNDYRGNFAAILAAVTLSDAMITVAKDFAFVCEKAAMIAAAPELAEKLAACLRALEGQPSVVDIQLGDKWINHLIHQARALLAKIDGKA
jgi:hypothetical protein